MRVTYPSQQGQHSRPPVEQADVAPLPAARPPVEQPLLVAQPPVEQAAVPDVAPLPVAQPPVVQPDAASLPVAQPPLRQMAGVAMLVSAGLAVGGSLAPHIYTAYSAVGGGPGRGFGYTTVANLWHTTYTGIAAMSVAEPGHDYIPGIPLMVGVALAVVAGVALLRTARYPGLGPRMWAVAAGGVVAGLTATDCLVAEATHSRQGIFVGTARLSAHYGAGMWLLMGAGLIAVGGAVAAALADRPRLAGPAASADPIVYAVAADESPTPPQGFPAQPELER